jgi:hypothetical protein
MSKLRIQLIVIVLTFAVGISTVAVSIHFQKPESIQINLPNSAWEPIFFGRENFKGGINQATEMVGIQELRKTVLPEGDEEIRIWRYGGLEAIILKRTGGIWSAFHLNAEENTDSFASVAVTKLNEPKSGWNSFWKQMSDRNLFELPDASEIDCLIQRLDGSV